MITEDKKRECVKRLILARMRLLSTNGFFGLLLMHAQFALDFTIETAATDGAKIYFSPKFMDDLSDKELDFVLMHEVLHIALKHCFRTDGRDEFLFNVACDVVVNSNILRSQNMDKRKITLTNYGEAMHTVPDGSEGYLYTAEEVYELIKKGLAIKILLQNLTAQPAKTVKTIMDETDKVKIQTAETAE